MLDLNADEPGSNLGPYRDFHASDDRGLEDDKPLAMNTYPTYLLPLVSRLIAKDRV